MRVDEGASVIWMGFAALAIYLSKKLDLGSLTNIGPGFVPFWSGVILFGLSLGIFLRDKKAIAKEKSKRIGELWTGVSWSKPVIVVFALVVYVLTFAHIGFLVSTAILLVFCLRAVEPVRWRVAIAVGLLTSFVSFALFNLWLQVQLPHWIIESYLYKLKGILF